MFSLFYEKRITQKNSFQAPPKLLIVKVTVKTPSPSSKEIHFLGFPCNKTSVFWEF